MITARGRCVIASEVVLKWNQNTFAVVSFLINTDLYLKLAQILFFNGTLGIYYGEQPMKAINKRDTLAS